MATSTLIVLLIILIASLIFVPFFRDRAKDSIDLQNNPLERKFEILVEQINAALMEGRGEVTAFKDDIRYINLMSNDQRNLKIDFYYSTGHLSIQLNYKYFQKELVRKYEYYDCRDITVFRQKDMANDFLFHARKEMQAFRMEVSKTMGVPDIHADETAGLDIECDGLQTIMNTYDELGKGTKRSIVNFAYEVYSAGARPTSWNEFSDEINLLQLLPQLKVTLPECKSQLDQYGDKRIADDLRYIESGLFAMILMSVMPFVLVNGVPDTGRIRRFYAILESAGHPQEKVDHEMEKAMAIIKMFSL